MRSCSSLWNFGSGILCEEGAVTLSGCVARNNSKSGIVVGVDSTVSGCTTTSNKESGISVAWALGTRARGEVGAFGAD